MSNFSNGKTIALVAFFLVAATALAGVTISGWLSYGSEIVLTYAEAGLSWCF
jgi:hypothetical protein